MLDVICIPNIQNYTLEIINGDLIITPKLNYITENEINMTVLKNSTILECIVKNGEENISTKTQYQPILTDIWKSIPKETIKQTAGFNFGLKSADGIRGYRWSDDIKMSFQGKTAQGTFKGILDMIKVNKYTIKIAIKLDF